MQTLDAILKPILAIVDRVLTFVLMVMVVAMVVSITGEILLNALIQPFVSSQIADLFGGIVTAEIAREKGGWAQLMYSVNTLISRLSSPINTISQTLMVWVGLLGTPLAFRHRAHLGVDALVRMYPRRVQLALDIVSTLLVAFFSAVVLVWGGWRTTSSVFASGTAMVGLEFLNRGWFYTVLFIAGGLNLLYAVHHLLHPVDFESESEEQLSVSDC